MTYRGKHLRLKPRWKRWADAALAVAAIITLLAIFVLGGGRNAVLRAATGPSVVLDGQFGEWSDAPSWSDPQYHGDPDEADLYPDQKEIHFAEDIQQVSVIENDDGIWFKFDRWPDSDGKGGMPQPVYYSVYFDLGMNHVNPDPAPPGAVPAYSQQALDWMEAMDWYWRFQEHDDPNSDPYPVPYEPGVAPSEDAADGVADWILICAFNPAPDYSRGEVMTAIYLAPAASVIPDPRIPPSQWPKYIVPVWPTAATDRAECEGDWGDPYDKSSGTGGLSVECGIPSELMTEVMGIQPGDGFQFFFSATMNNPLNKGFYPQQDFCPNDGDISRFDVPTLGAVGTIILFAAAIGIVYLGSRKMRPGASTGTGEAGGQA